MHLRFKLDPDRITLNQIIDMQSGDFRAMRDVLAASLVNGDGGFMDMAEAIQIIGSLKLSQVQGAAQEFANQVKNTAINPQSAGSSLPPSFTAGTDPAG